MSFGMVAVAGASLAAGAMGASAARGAAREQAAASDRATAAQREAMERQIGLQEPWRQAGGRGLNALMYGLGLSRQGTFVPGSDGRPPETAAQIRERLIGQYTRAPVPGTGTWMGDPNENPNMGIGGAPAPTPGTPGGVDAAALEAAVQAELARQPQPGGQSEPDGTGMGYGDLMRQFGRQDFETDPGYQWRQEQGERGLQRGMTARGMNNSGRALMDAMRFNSGLASDEYSRAFGRFTSNQDTRFNRLASIAGIGQTATRDAGNAVSAFGQGASNNIIGAGNAAAAGRMGAANAWSGAIGQGVSAYQNNNMLNRFFPQATSGWNNPNGWRGTSLGNHFLGFGTGGD